MAYTFSRIPVNNAVADLLTTVFADLKTALSAKLEGASNLDAVNETIAELEAAVVKQFFTKSKKVKKSASPDYKKKAPTPYNVFVREKMAELKLKEPGLDKQNKMKRIGELWRASKSSTAPAAPTVPEVAVAAPPAAEAKKGKKATAAKQ